MVVQGDGVQDEGVQEGVDSTQQCFRAAGAFCFVQIDNGWTFSGQGSSNLGGEGWAKAHSNSHCGAEFHEVTTIDATGFEFLFTALPAESNGNAHKRASSFAWLGHGEMLFVQMVKARGPCSETANRKKESQ